MDLSIIIVNWNSTDYLTACLASVYRETRGLSFEVIVIDNASTDGCEETLRRDFPQVKLILSHENLGFARANNIAYEHSGGDIVLFLNPDTDLSGNVLRKMVEHLRTHEQAGAVGVRLLNSDRTVQLSSIQAYPTLWNQLLDSEFLRRLSPHSRLWGMKPLLAPAAGFAEVDAISGACFMVKRDVFAKAGQFTEDYFMYVEDLDLSYKIANAGYRIHYRNDLTVVHHGGKSSAKQERHFASLHQREAILQFFQRTKGGLYCRAYRYGMAVSAAVRIVLVVGSMPFLRTAADRKPGLVLSKWWKTLHWALGVQNSQARGQA